MIALLPLIIEHMAIVAVAIAIAAAMGIALGIAAYWVRYAEPVILYLPRGSRPFHPWRCWPC
jgi:ABC-type proline/glycine betaine transport system permease subunit